MAAPTTPMEVVELRRSPDGPRPVLFVLLPGRHDGPEVFARQGFVSAVEEAGIDADVIAADAHLGYFLEGVFVPRLREDVIEPALARGYGRIWLAGVSLGGLGAIVYDDANPGHLTGIVSIAPYLGEPDVVAEVAAVGGPLSYRPGRVREGDFSREIWKMLGWYARPFRTRDRVFLGYGADDDFAPANALLAAQLPGDQALVVEGGHDWETWRKIWRTFLDRLPLPRR